MHGPRTLIIGGMLAALVFTAVGAPAAAQLVEKGRIAFVNGVPGTKVDVCISGKEVRSAVPYGGYRFRKMQAGPKTVRFYRADPRKCRGTLLAQKKVYLAPDGEYTVVVTKYKPGKVRVFGNTGLNLAPSAAWRHAGDMGTVELKYDLWLNLIEGEPLVPSSPAANGHSWDKGSRSHVQFPEGGLIRVKAYRYGRTWAMAKSPRIAYDPAQSVEWILVGTRPKNARFVIVHRDVLGAQ